MHPAFSVIFFTTASGVGYGILAILAVMAATGFVPLDRVLGIVGLGLSAVLVSSGLLSSTFHLGHPERAWRALTQWRSSWLSREGVLAIVTFAPWLVLAYLWIIEGEVSGALKIAAAASAVLALVTIYCTAMIYRSLKTIHQWHNGWTVLVYLTEGISTGAVWCAAILSVTVGVEDGFIAFAVLSVLTAWWVKRAYWRYIDSTSHLSTPKTATGLAGQGVRLLEGPHTEENYIQREMGFKVARKHAASLRRGVHLFGFFLPAFLLLLAMVGGDGGVAAFICILSAIVMSAGIVIERWLFFAEAKHVVTLYYGAQSA